MINWQDPRNFSIGNTNFRLFHWFEGDLQSTSDCFAVCKSRKMILDYERLFDQVKPKRIFELGIHQGGSSAFFQKLAEPAKVVAIDLDEQRLEILDQYIEDHHLSESLKAIYSVDQSDKETLCSIVEREFDGEALDIVLDDASHFLEETRKSFNALFPKLREGGVFVIEDWSWAHRHVDLPETDHVLYPDKTPLTKLIFEIVLAMPSTKRIIDEIVITGSTVYVRRGQGEIDEDSFDVAASCLDRGKNLLT